VTELLVARYRYRYSSVRRKGANDQKYTAEQYSTGTQFEPETNVMDPERFILDPERFILDPNPDPVHIKQSLSNKLFYTTTYLDVR
jgi:hypothetical protein